MRTPRPFLAAALAVVLSACGGSSDDRSTTSAVDFVTLRIYGASATYTDDAAGASILAGPGQSNNVVVNLIASTSGGTVNFQLSIPANTIGGSVPGTVTTIVAGHACSGAVTVNVTRNGTGLGAEVAGSFQETSVSCVTPPSPTSIAASFSATRLD